MATVTGFTKERMQEIENAAIVDGGVVGGELILTRFDETDINLGSVIGPAGPAGPSIEAVTHATRPGSPTNGKAIYETDTKRFFVWNGSAWAWFAGSPMRCKVRLLAGQSVADSDIDDIIWSSEEYDTDNIWTSGGSANILTIPAEGAGIWRVTLNAAFGISATGVRQFSIVHNSVVQCSTAIPGNSALPAGATLSVDLNCAVADTIKASVYHTAGAPLSINPFVLVNMSIIKLV